MPPQCQAMQENEMGRVRSPGFSRPDVDAPWIVESFKPAATVHTRPAKAGTPDIEPDCAIRVAASKSRRRRKHDLPRGSQNDPAIHQERPVLQIVNVVLDALNDVAHRLGFSAKSAHLRQTGEGRKCICPPTVPCRADKGGRSSTPGRAAAPARRPIGQISFESKGRRMRPCGQVPGCASEPQRLSGRARAIVVATSRVHRVGLER